MTTLDWWSDWKTIEASSKSRISTTLECADLDRHDQNNEEVSMWSAMQPHYAHEGLSSVSPKVVCENNVVGSVSVFTAGIRNKVKRIVYCSSMARYGNMQGHHIQRNILSPNQTTHTEYQKLPRSNILKILSNYSWL